ncbi:MAG: hypothetical protein KVP17_004192 [Porospora cf. gigantea B]|uniref:uncharacterized protein n=1 Tax=Porospora cf. gigantea B TaxID=2853592 RepID=UPI00357188CC|nr:MAG: hypothetical protein KVP17_004192 [Porospora cf. gigantea B]
MSTLISRGRRNTIVSVRPEETPKVLLISVLEARGLNCGACFVFFTPPAGDGRHDIRDSSIQFSTSTLDPRNGLAVWNEVFDLPWTNEWQCQSLEFKILRKHLFRKADVVCVGTLQLGDLESTAETWIEMRDQSSKPTVSLLVRTKMFNVDSQHFEVLQRRLHLVGSPKPRKDTALPADPKALRAGNIVIEQAELGAGDVSDLSKPEDIGRLNVEITCGHHLIPRAASSAAEVGADTRFVCKFFWRDRKFLTSVSEPSNSPEWLEFFSFPLDEAEAKDEWLVVSVFTDAGALVGSACLAIESVGISTKTGDWYMFRHGQCGQVYIQCVVQVDDLVLRRKLVERQQQRQKLTLMEKYGGFDVAITPIPTNKLAAFEKQQAAQREKMEAVYVQFSNTRTLTERLDMLGGKRITITACRGRDLPTRDISTGGVFPVCRIQYMWCGRQYKTTAVKGVNPEWMHSEQLTTTGDIQVSTVLDLQVVDEQSNGDVHIGVARLDLLNLDSKGKCMDLWVHLDTRGAVRMRVQVESVPVPPPKSTPIASPVRCPTKKVRTLYAIPEPNVVPVGRTCMSLQLISALNVENTFSLLSRSPFVRMTWNGQTFSSQYAKNHKQPVWQETFDLRWDMRAEVAEQEQQKILRAKTIHQSLESQNRVGRRTSVFDDQPKRSGKIISLHLYCHSILRDTYVCSAHIDENHLDLVKDCSTTFFLPLTPFKNPKMVTDLDPMTDYMEVGEKPVLCLRVTKFTTIDGTYVTQAASRRKRRSSRITSVVTL